MLPFSLKEIDNGAFENCVSLKAVTLPVQLERIGAGAFKNTVLKTVKIQKSVYWIGEELFAGCRDIDHIAISKNIDRITPGCLKVARI